MLTAGIDAGADVLKVVLLGDEGILSHVIVPLETKSVDSVAQNALKEAAEKASVSLHEIERILVTGNSNEYITFLENRASEAVCCSRGANYLIPNAATIIDLGANSCLVVRTDNGALLKSVRNDRCASGTGRFVQIAAEPLGMTTQEMGEISLMSEKVIEINSTCAVFAESEIISLIHSRENLQDIAKAVFRGLARRIYTLLIKVEYKPDLVMVGGGAKNVGMIKAIEEQTDCPVIVPQEPMIVGALGAALVAMQ